MDPATPDELDRIIRELLDDQGPPLLVSDDRGVVHEAGVRMPNPNGAWGRWATKANNADEVKLRWEQLRRQVDQEWTHYRNTKPKLTDIGQKLAGDVFHEELERLELKEAIAKAINEGREADVKRIAAEAIAKAVRGQTSEAGDER